MTKTTQSPDLRRWQEGDEGALVKIANNRKIWREIGHSSWVPAQHPSMGVMVNPYGSP